MIRDPQVIRTVKNPLRPKRLAVLYGNIALRDACQAVRCSDEMLSTRGLPVCLILRTRRPKRSWAAGFARGSGRHPLRGTQRGPGSARCSRRPRHRGMGLDAHRALITDGRFSGGTRGAGDRATFRLRPLKAAPSQRSSRRHHQDRYQEKNHYVDLTKQEISSVFQVETAAPK